MCSATQRHANIVNAFGNAFTSAILKVIAITTFAFAERVCFCLAFLCFAFYSRETKPNCRFTTLFGDRDIELEIII